MADKCDPIRAFLHDLEVQLANTEHFLVEEEPGRDVHKPVVNPEWRRLEKRVEAARIALQQCEESLISNTPVSQDLEIVWFSQTRVALAKQTNDILTAAAVDSHGTLQVASVEGMGLWQGPMPVGETLFAPRSNVPLATQRDHVFT